MFPENNRRCRRRLRVRNVRAAATAGKGPGLTTAAINKYFAVATAAGRSLAASGRSDEIYIYMLRTSARSSEKLHRTAGASNSGSSGGDRRAKQRQVTPPDDEIVGGETRARAGDDKDETYRTRKSYRGGNNGTRDVRSPRNVFRTVALCSVIFTRSPLKSRSHDEPDDGVDEHGSPGTTTFYYRVCPFRTRRCLRLRGY